MFGWRAKIRPNRWVWQLRACSRITTFGHASQLVAIALSESIMIGGGSPRICVARTCGSCRKLVDGSKSPCGRCRQRLWQKNVVMKSMHNNRADLRRLRFMLARELSILIVGLDGATFDLMLPWIDD